MFPEKFDKAYMKSIKKAAQKSGKKRKKDYVQQEEDGECDADEVKKKKPKKVMPNYFVAVQVTNSKVSVHKYRDREMLLYRIPFWGYRFLVPVLHVLVLKGV